MSKATTPVKYAMISQPMAGKSDKEIVATREHAIKVLEDMGYTVINTLFTDEWYSDKAMEERGVINRPLVFFAKSIENMTRCNAVYFCNDWARARGCTLEHAVAEAYGLDIICEEVPTT